MKIIPAILTNSVDVYRQEMETIIKSSSYDQVQVDFIDEQYDNQTISVMSTFPKDYEPLKFDAHLMVDGREMEIRIGEARKLGFERIIAQLESLDDQKLFLEWTQGFKRGLAVDLDTSIEQIDDLVLPELDVVLLMAVEAGFGNQLFDNRVLEKVKYLTGLRKSSGYDFKICVDGGVEKIHLPILEEMGADEVAVGVKRVLSF